MRFPVRSPDVLFLLGFLLVLPALVLPVGNIHGFQVETQAIYLFQQDAFYKLALLFPLLAALSLLLRARAIVSPSPVVCHAALALLFCIYIVFLYFRFHFAAPDPTWVAPVFLLGYTLLFLGHLKTLFFPYEFLRAHQPGLPDRRQAPPTASEIWGPILLVVGVMLGFRGYYAHLFLEQGTQYLLIIAGTIELTPLQRIRVLLGTGTGTAVCGLVLLLRRQKKHAMRKTV